ncbi:hypothetical protein BLOT_004601 [Blomia tropicalis]|nr:hypothetical protein BLOT_004601 [Blomia tropicalis]
MYDALLRMVIEQKIVLGAVLIVAGLILGVLVLWIYAELLFWRQKKLEKIEAARDIMDGIELRMRQRRNSRQTKVIKLKNLDKTNSHINTKYSKIKISKNIEQV